MIEIECPWCGPRGSREFTYLGSHGERPDPATVTLEEWRAFLYLQTNLPTWTDERWLHLAGCGEAVAVRRNVVTNELTYPSTDTISSRPA